MEQYNLSNSVIHGHPQVMHQDYLAVPQMGVSQNYQAPSPNSYGSIPMATVIQHRMANNHSNLSSHNPLSSPHQRHGPSPSSCSVNNNFYVQSTNVPHPVSHTPVPTPTPTPSGTPTIQQQLSANIVPNNGGVSNPTLVTNVSSLSKLQQLTNGLEMNQPCNTPPGASVNLTPSPNHHPHSTMTPPPASHLANQNRNLPTPPSASQMTALQYHKYYSGNVTTPLAIGQNSNRSTRNTASAPVQHMSAGSPSSRVSPNVTISSNLMAPYMNGYRGQQPASYITNSAAGFINNTSQLQMAGVMNMQSQYQDPAALQRAAQQNSMYQSYPYIPLNANPMRR